ILSAVIKKTNLFFAGMWESSSKPASMTGRAGYGSRVVPAVLKADILTWSSSHEARFGKKTPCQNFFVPGR
ncbi:MAG: hypothetical protein WCI18_02755, partial [Pseudomonadota bacterium]